MNVRLIPIHSPDDPRIAVYRNVRERDLVGREGRFLAEGEVVVRLLLTKSRYRAESLLLEERRVAGLADVLAHHPELAVYVAPQAVMNEIAGFPIHRGILAAGLRGEEPSPDELLASIEGPATVVALEAIANHDNVGGIFRNAAAFGAKAVLLDGTSCDPLYRKAIRVSVGAALRVPFARSPSSAEMIATLRRAGFAIFALTPRREAKSLESFRFPERSALLLGAEGPGLLDATLASADEQLRIEIESDFDSLNVASASAIALHAARISAKLSRIT